MRLAAARSLAGRSEPRAVEVLARLIEDPDLAVRAVAVRALPGPDALRAALHDEAPQVGAAALAGLVALLGRERMLADAAALVAELPAGSAERALAARAWLVP